jgi:WD40 repeat protein
MARSRGRAVVAFGAVAVAASIAAVAASVIAVRRSDEARRARDAEAAQELAAASLAADERSPERALLLALEAYERDASYAARNALLTAWERNVRLRNVFGDYRGQATGLRFSPDGRTLAVAATTDSETSTIQLFDVARRRVVLRIRSDLTYKIWFSHDGRTLFSASSYGRLHTWDAHSGVERHKAFTILPYAHHFGDDPGYTEVSDDGSAVVTMGPHGALTVWSTDRGRALLARSVGDTALVTPTLSPNGRYLALLDRDALSLWDLRRHRRLPGAPGTARAAAFAGDSKTLALTTPHGIVRWNVERDREVRPRLDAGHVSDDVLAFSPDGHRLVSAGGRRAWIWNLERTVPRPRPLEGQGSVYGAEFSPDSHLVVLSWSTGETFYDAATRRPLTSPIAFPLPIAVDGDSLWTFSPDGATVASAADDGVVRTWSVARGLPLEATVVQRPDPADCCESASSIAFTPDGRVLVAARDTGGMTLWDLRRRSGHAIGGDAARMAVSPDGTMVAGISTPDGDGLELWDLAHLAPLAAPPQANMCRWPPHSPRAGACSQCPTARTSRSGASLTTSVSE